MKKEWMKLAYNLISRQNAAACARREKIRHTLRHYYVPAAQLFCLRV
jgi:hypothetical protein